MTILGQTSQPRRRPIGVFILTGFGVAILGIVAFLYAMGGEQPVSRVEKTLEISGQKK